MVGFIGFEKLVWVGACRDDHRCVCATSENTAVEHQVVRYVVIVSLVLASVGVFVFLLLLNNAGRSSLERL